MCDNLAENNKLAWMTRVLAINTACSFKGLSKFQEDEGSFAAVGFRTSLSVGRRVASQRSRPERRSVSARGMQRHVSQRKIWRGMFALEFSNIPPSPSVGNGRQSR